VEGLVDHEGGSPVAAGQAFHGDERELAIGGRLARLQAEAPPDIVTSTSRRVRLDDPVGLSASQMTERQREGLLALLREYLGRMPAGIAHSRMNRLEKEGVKHLHFAWAGGQRHGEPHYYRVHGPSLLLEYDNTQDSANHIHSVWRDLTDDWGEDLLRQHYVRSHGPKA